MLPQNTPASGKFDLVVGRGFNLVRFAGCDHGLIGTYATTRAVLLTMTKTAIQRMQSKVMVSTESKMLLNKWMTRVVKDEKQQYDEQKRGKARGRKRDEDRDRFAPGRRLAAYGVYSAYRCPLMKETGGDETVLHDVVGVR